MIGNCSTPCPKDAPEMVAWEEYKQTEEYANSKKWAAYPQHVDGSLWASYLHGYQVATERAAQVCESRAGLRSTGAWTCLTAAARAIRQRFGKE